MKRWYALGIGSLAFAGVAGGLAVAGSSQQEPTSTTTISVATGPQGATGPAGPAGGQICLTGFHHGLVVINHPGGQVTIDTCVKN